VRAHVNAVQKAPRLLRRQHWCFTLVHDVLRAANGGGWIGSNHLTYNKPVEKMAESRKPLLDRGRRTLAVELFNDLCVINLSGTNEITTRHFDASEAQYALELDAELR
jgi:hypothetical protein